MFSLVGLGPRPPDTLQLAALEALRRADTVYLEVYTNLGFTVQELSEFLERPVLPAPRTTVESDEVLTHAKDKHIALCVIGDIFSATTHSTLYLECLEKKIPFQLFPNAGVMNTIALAGLELYSYGETISIPYPIGEYKPDSYLAKIRANRDRGLHTLCLLDIRADENRFMTIPEALALLEPLQLELAIGVARLAQPDMVIRAGSPAALARVSWGSQPHSLIVPGKLNAVESEFISRWRA